MRQSNNLVKEIFLVNVIHFMNDPKHQESQDYSLCPLIPTPGTDITLLEVLAYGSEGTKTAGAPATS